MSENKDKKKLKLPDIEKDFSEWYNSVVFEAELVEHAPTRGCIVIRPYGYSIWEEIQRQLDEKIKSMGVKNAAFPLLIPASFIEAEKDHVEGFAPEVVVATHAGGKELEEKLVIRPTSETIIHWMFARWIRSWRDLPLKINQWCSVVRWERRPRPFIRTTEFWWQEGHTAHKNREEANEQANEARETYYNFIEKVLAIPVVTGKKPQYERFAGADETLTLEAMMPDGKALQMGTSHILGQGFCESFKIQFQDSDGVLKSPVLTSWGVTTRLIGALIMSHGDQKGLIIPPKLAPIQIVLIPFFKEGINEFLVSEIEKLSRSLNEFGFRVFFDSDKEERPGFKFNKWELKGVPFRIEIGEKELQDFSFIFSRRDSGEKIKVNYKSSDFSLKSFIEGEIEDLNKRIYKKAQKRLEEKTYDSFFSEEEWGSSIQEKNGFYKLFWCGKAETIEIIKKYSASVRCVLEENEEFELMQCCTCFKGSCKPKYKVIVAKSY